MLKDIAEENHIECCQYEYSCPLVSIITPSFNQGRFIEETLLSVKNQTYKNIEHIVIDACSTDQTLEILKKHGSTIFWISEPDNGQTDAINKGMRKSHGEILAYLNSDDLYLPETITAVVDYFSKNPNIEMVYGDIIHIDQNSSELETVKTGNIILENYLTCQVYLPQPTVFFRKSIIEKVGFFDDQLHLAMDLDYWIRVFFVAESAYIPQPLAKARFHSETKSYLGYLNSYEEYVYILGKVFNYNKAIRRRFYSEMWIRKIKNKAYGYVNFFGGLRLLRHRKFIKALRLIYRGLSYYPRLFLNPYLCWSLFIAVVGFHISDLLIPYLPRIKKVF